MKANHEHYMIIQQALNVSRYQEFKWIAWIALFVVIYLHSMENIPCPLYIQMERNIQVDAIIVYMSRLYFSAQTATLET